MALDIIAEVGSVHDGSFGNACKLIELAKELGATTVKFQMHLPQHETTHSAPSPTYFAAEPRFDYFKRTGFEPSQWKSMVALAKDIGIGFCCSPFSIEALDLLVELGVDRIKVASGEVTNIPLMEAAGARAKQVILSSGMSSWSELDAAVAAIQKGSADLLVMQCSSQYPCAPDNVGLNVIDEMAARYGCPVGYSDHTLGVAAPVGAIFHGAEAVEKHLTFSQKMYGSDAKHSMEPAAFRTLVEALNEAYAIHRSPVSKDNVGRYRGMKDTFEKSLVALVALSAGTQLERSHIGYKKPGTGIAPSEIDLILGKKLKNDVPADHLFSEDDIS